MLSRPTALTSIKSRPCLPKFDRRFRSSHSNYLAYMYTNYVHSQGFSLIHKPLSSCRFFRILKAADPVAAADKVVAEIAQGLSDRP